MIRSCSGGPETTILFNCESPINKVLPIRIDSGPDSSDGLERLLPPSPPLLVPENPPVVPLEAPELLLLEPVKPVEPVLEAVDEVLLDVLEVRPAPVDPPSTNLDKAFVATGIKSMTGIYLSSRLRKLST